MALAIAEAIGYYYYYYYYYCNIAIINNNDDNPDQPLDARTNQKEQRYGGTATRNGFALVAATFSYTYTGQIDVAIKNLFLEQIRPKLQLVDCEV